MWPLSGGSIRHGILIATYRPGASPSSLLSHPKEVPPMLYINFFADGDVLLEAQPQADAFIAVRLNSQDAEGGVESLISAEVSAAMARLFLAGLADLQPRREVKKSRTALDGVNAEDETTLPALLTV